MEKKDLCRFCQKQFKPKTDTFFGSLEEFLCPKCTDLMTRFVRAAVLKAVQDLNVLREGSVEIVREFKVLQNVAPVEISNYQGSPKGTGK